jgi:BASS family bile acid:Na+ symporter
MSVIIKEYSTMLIILAGILLGFMLPNVGLMWKPFLPYLLMLLMFFVSLTVEAKDIGDCFRKYRVIAFCLFMVFVFTPLLSVFAKVFFSSNAYSGTVLAFCSPSAIATGFWSSVFNADVAIALVISTVTSLLAIITIPLTMFLFVGTMVGIDVGWMILNLSEMILVPLGASFLLKGIASTSVKRLTRYSSKLNLIIMTLLIWGSASPGVEYVRNHVTEFMSLNVFMIIMLGIAFGAAYEFGKRYGRKRAITIGIATCVKNATLALVLGATMFGPNALSPLIANLIAQNVLLIPLKMVLRE